MASKEGEKKMSKFEPVELLTAMYAANIVVLNGLAAQGAIDKVAVIEFIQATIDRPDREPLLPAAAFVLSKMVEHLGAGDPAPWHHGSTSR